MPNSPTIAQSATSRQNGARSAGPATDAGKARSALNGVRHGLSGRTFFLLPDEDPAGFERHESVWLAAWAPRDLHEHEAAGAAIRAMWREERADRLEAVVLGDLFAAGRLPDPAEAEAAKAVAFKALNTLLRYRARIERELRVAMQALEALRRRRRPHRPPRRDRANPSAPAPAPPHRPAAAPRRRPGPGAGPSRAAKRTRARPRPEPPPAPGHGRDEPPRRLTGPPRGRADGVAIAATSA